MKWVTWENVGVDRIGCAWLIHKYIDPKAELWFIPPTQKDLPKGAERLCRKPWLLAKHSSVAAAYSSSGADE
jgi:hypothetical protein